MVTRYWHTLRYLRPVQFYGRLWFRLYRPKPDLRPAPAVRPVQGRWMAPVAKPVSMLGPSTFRFINEINVLAVAGHGPADGSDVNPPGHVTAGSQKPSKEQNRAHWNDPARDKLWLYNLHYFDDLNASGGDERYQWHLALLERWVAENPPGQGNGWEPYPTSLRIVNWIKWSLAFAPERGGMPTTLPPACLHSLAVQARWLGQRLEHHLLGNHLFANAKALVFTGAFFVGPEADRWRRLGLRLLTRELADQILPDGGHFERSPMYHAILLEDVLDVLNLALAYPGLFGSEDGESLSLWRAKATAMRRWLAVMCHPDGEISFFNDAAFGIAPTLAELTAYSMRLEVAAEEKHDRTEHSQSVVMWLRDSGYIRLEAGSAVVLLDVAPIGPDYLPGHAHADTLSFELSLFGQRVIVNGGTSRYGSGPERLAERGTAAHSTVQIDGADSSEVWGGFRVARRARPMDVRVQKGGADSVAKREHGPRLRGLEVSAVHDGYRRLPGQPVHRRTWCLTPGRLSVSDTIDGGFETAVARFHLHPTIEVACDGDSLSADEDLSPAGHFLLPDGRLIHWRVLGGRVKVVPDHWHPEFGLSLPSRCLVVMVAGDHCQLDLSWVPGS